MRANITYSVELDELPKEIAHITIHELEKLSVETSNALEFLYDARDSGDCTALRKCLEDFSASLTKADTRLQEALQITAGYILSLIEAEQSALVPNDSSADVSGSPTTASNESG